MTSFTSSFRQVLLAPDRRREYLAIGVTIALTLVLVGVACQSWIGNQNRGPRLSYLSLDEDTELLIVGSSHLLGQTPDLWTEDAVNVSHAANSLQMMHLTIQAALRRAPEAHTAVVEIGPFVSVSDPTRIRDHAFRELGVNPWSFPGDWYAKLWTCVESYPPFRVPRLTPHNLLVRSRRDLNAQAQGIQVETMGTYQENGEFRARGIIQSLLENPDGVQQNLASLRKMLEELQQQNIRVIVVVTPHAPSFRSRLTQRESQLLEEIKEICAGFSGVSTVDVFDSEQHGFDQSMFADADHLNMSGHRQLASIIQDRMNQFGNSRMGER